MSPKDEDNHNDQQDIRYEMLLVNAKVVIQHSKKLDELKLMIDNNIEVYDELVDELLNDFPQHMADDLKYKIGE